MTTKSALIIGASRGLGLGLVQEYAARGWDVVGTVRDSGTLLHKVPGIEVETLDINDPAQILALRSRLQDRAFDLLFVNAGVMMSNRAETVGAVATEEFTRVMTTNALSPMRVMEALGPLVAAQGVIAVMTSVLGSVSGNTGGGTEVYRASKAALNSLLKSFAARQGKTQTFLAVHPGWVQTEIGGPNAPLDVATSARGMADMIGKRTGTPGVAFVNYDNTEIPW